MVSKVKSCKLMMRISCIIIKQQKIDNLIWYFSELFKSELKIAIGPVERGGAGGGIAAVLNGLYQAEN